MNDYSLYDTWNGYERFTDSWCVKQAELMEQFLCEETIDARGIIQLLTDASQDDRDRAENILVNLMAHLVHVTFCSYYTSDNAYKMERRHECIHIMNDFHDLFFEQEPHSEKEKRKNFDLDNKGEEIAAIAWKDALDLVDKIKKDIPGYYMDMQLPSECPWTFEQLLNEESLDFLLEILREKCSQNNY